MEYINALHENRKTRGYLARWNLEAKLAEAALEADGYKMLGWQVHSGNCEPLKKCLEAGHTNNNQRKEWQHSQRGSDVTFWCDTCRHYWKIDMSD